MKKVAYILERFPALSETFVLNEVLELERQGANLEIISITKQKDSIIHQDFFKLKTKTHYLRPRLVRYFLAFAAFLYFLLIRPEVTVKSLIKTLTRIRDVGLFRRIKHFLLACLIAFGLYRRSIDHLHTHFARGSAFIVMIIHWLLDIPYSFTAHAADIFVDPKSIPLKIHEASFVATISDFNKNYFKDHFEIPQKDLEKIYIIRCGIDLEKFKPRNLPKEGEPLILTVARLVEKKGHRYLLEALARLKKQGADFAAVLVGGGPLKEPLEQLAEDLNILDRITFAGVLEHEKVRKLLDEAFVFVLPCVEGKDKNKDGIPVALMEAMAMEIPVITTPLSGNPELIDNEVNGLLVPEKDVGELNKALHRIISDRKFSIRLGENARKKIKAEFELSDNVSKLKKLYEMAHN
jgi:glycosyltransferase involved in cell wall biosynthesis